MMTPIVFLHGFMGSQKDWGPLISALPTHFDVMTPSLPGHDETPLIQEPNLIRIATHFIEKLETRNVHLVGYSLGGRIALKICELIPQQIKSLTLISAAPGIKSETEINERKVSDMQWTEKIDTDFKAFLQDWYQQPLFSDLSELERKNMIERRLKNNPQDLKQIFAASGQASNPHSWGVIEALKCPALFITGEYDQKYQNIGKDVVSLNPNFRLSIIPQAGHSPHITQPNRTSESIKHFLEQIDLIK